MTHVATLIANPANPILKEGMAKKVASLLKSPSAPHWLAPGIAVDVAFTPGDGFDQATCIATLRQALEELPLDIAVQPVLNRRKKLLVADMDSTMIGQECIDELADFVDMKDHVSAITERAMRGEIAFEPALRERVALLKGLPVSVIKEVIATRITLTPGARELVATMRANGAFTALVSGGFTLFTQHVADTLGFHMNQANVLEVEGAHLAGTVAEPILGKEAKRASLLALCALHGLADSQSLAVGDGANDLAMLGVAGLGIAYHAKPAVAAAAHARIDHGDLTGLLYLQGYSRDEFAGQLPESA